jgi:hypothetical protein
MVGSVRRDGMVVLKSTSVVSVYYHNCCEFDTFPSRDVVVVIVW